MARLRRGQQQAGFAQQIARIAGFGEHSCRTPQPSGLFPGMNQVCIVPGKQYHLAFGEFAVEVVHEFEAASARHADVAEQQMRGEAARALERIVCRIRHPNFKALFAEDEAQGIGYEAFVVDYKDAMHRNPFRENVRKVRIEGVSG